MNNIPLLPGVEKSARQSVQLSLGFESMEATDHIVQKYHVPQPLSIREYEIMLESMRIHQRWSNAKTDSERTKILAEWNEFCPLGQLRPDGQQIHIPRSVRERRRYQACYRGKVKEQKERALGPRLL